MKDVDTIKCGRTEYVLTEGDTVMDNGFCYRLISRRTSTQCSPFAHCPPKVSKAAFKKFINNSNVIKISDNDHNYSNRVILYRYTMHK